METTLVAKIMQLPLDIKTRCSGFKLKQLLSNKIVINLTFWHKKQVWKQHFLKTVDPSTTQQRPLVSQNLTLPESGGTPPRAAYWRSCCRSNRVGVTTLDFRIHDFAFLLEVSVWKRASIQPVHGGMYMRKCSLYVSVRVSEMQRSWTWEGRWGHHCVRTVVPQRRPTWLRMTASGLLRASLATWEAPNGLSLSRTSWSTNVQVKSRPHI